MRPLPALLLLVSLRPAHAGQAQDWDLRVDAGGNFWQVRLEEGVAVHHHRLLVDPVDEAVLTAGLVTKGNHVGRVREEMRRHGRPDRQEMLALTQERLELQSELLQDLSARLDAARAATTDQGIPPAAAGLGPALDEAQASVAEAILGIEAGSQACKARLEKFKAEAKATLDTLERAPKVEVGQADRARLARRESGALVLLFSSGEIPAGWFPLHVDPISPDELNGSERLPDEFDRPVEKIRDLVVLVKNLIDRRRQAVVDLGEDLMDRNRSGAEKAREAAILLAEWEAGMKVLHDPGTDPEVLKGLPDLTRRLASVHAEVQSQQAAIDAARECKVTAMEQLEHLDKVLVCLDATLQAQLEIRERAEP